MLASALFIVFTVKANAVSAATLIKSYSGYIFDRMDSDGSNHHSWYWDRYEMDGEAAFCIEPNVPEGITYPQVGWEETGLPNSIKERLVLIGYYGYTYPGTFVEALNRNNAFDKDENLQYAGVIRVVPAFKYVGNQNLRGKTKTEKLSLIKKYLNSDYYITAEVKGAIVGREHWVAVISVESNNVMMVDPSSNQTIMWNAYNYEKASQFNFFKVDG